MKSKVAILVALAAPALSACDTAEPDSVPLSIEFRASALVVDTTLDFALPPGYDHNCECEILLPGGDEMCSLRAAVQIANACTGHDVIEIAAAGTHNLTLFGPSAGTEAGDIDITDPVTIMTVGSIGVTVDAKAIDDRIFDIHPSAGQVMLSGFKVDNGLPTASDPSAEGGCIRAHETELTLYSMVVGGDPSQTAPGDPHPGEGCVGANGGGVAAFDSSVTATSTKFAGNEAIAAGAGDGLGGGLYAPRTNVSIEGGFVLRNAAEVGAGLHVTEPDKGGWLLLDGTTLAHNLAATHGGGGYVDVGFEIMDTTFHHNDAGFSPGHRGGALYAGPKSDGGLLLGTDMHDNSAYDGGGVAVHAKIRIEQSRFDLNEAIGSVDFPGRGGGIFVDEAGTTEIEGASITRNHAVLGAGVWAKGGHVATNVTYADNEAIVAGGGIAIEGGDSVLLHTTIRDNIAPDGGGIWETGGSVRLDRSILDGNVGDECSGSVDNLGGNVSGPITCLSAGWTPASGPWGTLGGQPPLTFTDVIPISPPNSAVGLAKPCGTSVDQRGISRLEEACDAGAYESDSAAG